MFARKKLNGTNGSATPTRNLSHMEAVARLRRLKDDFEDRGIHTDEARAPPKTIPLTLEDLVVQVKMLDVSPDSASEVSSSCTIADNNSREVLAKLALHLASPESLLNSNPMDKDVLDAVGIVIKHYDDPDVLSRLSGAVSRTLNDLKNYIVDGRPLGF